MSPTPDTTALRRGVFMLVTTESGTLRFWLMPRACPVVLHAPRYEKLAKKSGANMILHGASPWYLLT